MASGPVLIVSADARWLRVLEVTIRLGGSETISRHSVTDALRMRAGDLPPTAIVVDLGAQASATELDEVLGLVHENALPSVVILPERLATERARLADVGATVLVRPYRPSELYAALWPNGSPAGVGAVVSDAPLTVDEAAVTDDPGDAAEG